MSHTASRKGGYGKSPERKAAGRVTRRQDDRSEIEAELVAYLNEPTAHYNGWIAKWRRWDHLVSR